MGLMLPGELVTVLQDLGYNWPEADEEALFDIAQRWMDFAPRLDAVASSAHAAVQPALAANSGEAIEAFARLWQAEDSPLASLRDAGTGAHTVGPLMVLISGVVLALKINVIVQLTVLVVEIAQAVATAPPTFGASLAEIPVFKEITSRLVNLLISLAVEQVLGG
jgi:hypothetical protein